MGFHDARPVVRRAETHAAIGHADIGGVGMTASSKVVAMATARVAVLRRNTHADSVAMLSGAEAMPGRPSHSSAVP